MFHLCNTASFYRNVAFSQKLTFVGDYVYPKLSEQDLEDIIDDVKVEIEEQFETNIQDLDFSEVLQNNEQAEDLLAIQTINYVPLLNFSDCDAPEQQVRGLLQRYVENGWIEFPNENRIVVPLKVFVGAYEELSGIKVLEMEQVPMWFKNLICLLG